MTVDWARMMSDHGVPHVIETDGWVNVDCPICLHVGSRGFKGGLNVGGGYYHCWACGGHRIEEVLVALLGIEWHEAPVLMERYALYGASRRRKSIEHAADVRLPMDELDDRCRDYLASRSFDPDEIHERYGVVGATLVGPWANRILIPIRYEGRVVSFQGRSLMSKRQCKRLDVLRYMTLSKERSVLDPKTILYGIDDCVGDTVIVVEGAFDRWRVGDDCVATLGTSTTPEQRVLLARRFKRVYVLFDSEPEAQARARKLQDMLVNLGPKEVHVIDTELDHDPGDMTKEEVWALRETLGL